MAVVRPNPDLKFLVKDSGVLLENFKEKYDTATNYEEFVDAYLEAMDTPDYIGITRGGTSSSMENETRIVEYDGRRVRSVGDFVVDSASPQIETTILPHTVENMRRVYPMSDVIIDATGKTILRPRIGSPQPSDYMESLSWVREMVNGDIKVVTLFNAINTANPAETGADKSESEMAATFVGNAASWQDTEYAPVEIITWSREPATTTP